MSSSSITKAELIKLYTSPGHPIAFSSPGTVYHFFKKEIPLRFIQNVLKSVDAYTLHREYKKAKVNNPHYSYFRRYDFQCDLIDIAGLKTDNDGVTFLLLIIDLFSRKIWLYPQTSKTAKNTEIGLNRWIQEIGNSTKKRLLSDSGLEFRANSSKEWFKKNNVIHRTATNINKASIAERANKSIQIIIYKYLTDRGETRYLDVLPHLVQSYNDRPHRTLQNMSPNEADNLNNETKVRSIHSQRYGNIKKKKATLAVGDTVRIKSLPGRISSGSRAYHQQFKGELFKITRINMRMPIPMYFIRSMDTDEDISGGFYANELTEIRGDTFKIEQIIKSRGKGRRKQHFVKWKYFGPDHNSWISAADLIST